MNTEPLLQPTLNRYVLFPIQYNDVSSELPRLFTLRVVLIPYPNGRYGTCTSEHKRASGLLKKSISHTTSLHGTTN